MTTVSFGDMTLRSLYTQIITLLAQQSGQWEQSTTVQSSDEQSTRAAGQAVGTDCRPNSDKSPVYSSVREESPQKRSLSPSGVEKYLVSVSSLHLHPLVGGFVRQRHWPNHYFSYLCTTSCVSWSKIWSTVG